MSLYLAIDAGGTKTECLLADDARVLARGSTGTVKLMRVSELEASARLDTMLEEIAMVAGVLLADVTRTCMGLAGVSSEAVRTWAQRVLSAKVGGALLLVGDEEIALDAAFHGGPGILVVAGTGSNVVGRAASGKLFFAGGWGSMLGDEGSGYWIGVEAIRAALRAQDRIDTGGGSSRLLREIEEHWRLHSLDELVALANHQPAPDFAALAPVVARCAEGGDSLAARLLERAGEELAEQVALVFRKIEASGPTPQSGPQPLGVAFTGSVLAQIDPVRAAMGRRLSALTPHAKIRTAPVDPLDGALWRARRS